MGLFGWLNNIRKKITGQATFEEADQKYEELIRRFNQHKAYFESETEKCIQKIESAEKPQISQKKETGERLSFFNKSYYDVLYVLFSHLLTS